MTRTIRSLSTSSSESHNHHTSSSPTNGSTLPEPKFFAKSGHWDQAPNEVKKNGHGKFNWGTAEDEVNELELSGEFNFARQRRRSNSNSKFDNVPAKDIRPKSYENEIDEDEENYAIYEADYENTKK